MKLSMLSAAVLREFIDERQNEGAGRVTVAADLSFLSAVLKWAKHSRRLDINDRLALEAKESLKHLSSSVPGCLGDYQGIYGGASLRDLLR